MENLQKDTEDKLRLAIKSAGLEKYTDRILDASRECIRIVATDELDHLSVGESRIGGSPDLEEKSQWPLYGYGENRDGLSVFYFQVNLHDIPMALVPELPKQGLLSVFSTSQNQLEDDGTILYLSSPNELCTQCLPNIFEFGDKDLDNKFNIAACFHKPRKLEFEVSVSLPGYFYAPDFIEEDDLEAYLDLESNIPNRLQGEEIGFMYSHFLQGMPEEDDPKWFTLFNISSDSQYFSFGDCGNCGISLMRDRARSGDFTEANFCYCE